MNNEITEHTGRYKQGDRVRIDGDGTEYEVVGVIFDKDAKTEKETNFHFTLRPVADIDVEQPERVTAPKNDENGSEDV